MSHSTRTWAVRGSLALALTGAFVLSGAPVASASTGGVSGGVLTYTATANENNDVLIWPTSATPGAITLDDFGTASLVAGANCPLVSGELRCTGVTSIVLNLGNLGRRRGLDRRQSFRSPTTLQRATTKAMAAQVATPSTWPLGSTTSKPTVATTPWLGSTEDDDALMGDGNDVVSMGDGTDTVFGEAGDDTFTQDDDQSDDYVYGGSGIDLVDYSSRAQRVNVSLDGVQNDGEVGENDFIEADIEDLIGGDGNDDLNGNDLGANVIDGGEGNDNIGGGGGVDTLIGGNGEDSLFGGGGADTVDGGNDGDTLKGGANVDTITGGAGNDDLSGSTENDNLDGGAGDDSLLGETGDDTLTDPSGSNSLDGGPGDDQITGGSDAETIFGREGSDIIGGGDGNDTLNGGPDVDILDGGRR